MDAHTNEKNEKTKKIWIEFGKQLKSFIIKRVSDASFADDILQEVFIKIHSNVDTLKDEQKIKAWIYQITRNSIVDYYRRKRLNTKELDESLGYEAFAEEESEKEIASGLKDMVNELPSKYSEALNLTEFEGLKQKELAKKIGLSVSAAKNRVQRARQMIKDDLMRCCHFEFDRYGTIIDYHPITCCCCH